MHTLNSPQIRLPAAHHSHPLLFVLICGRTFYVMCSRSTWASLTSTSSRQRPLIYPTLHFLLGSFFCRIDCRVVVGRWVKTPNNTSLPISKVRASPLPWWIGIEVICVISKDYLFNSLSRTFLCFLLLLQGNSFTVKWPSSKKNGHHWNMPLMEQK